MKRTYTEIVSSLETHIVYINNHLGNIDAHLQRQNDTIDEQGEEITQNTTNIKWIMLIGGGLFTLIGGGIAVVLKLMGIY